MTEKYAKYDSHIAFRQWYERDENTFLQMLNAFLQPPQPFLKVELPVWEYSFLFMTEGAFSDALAMYVEDTAGTKYYIEWACWELHWGMANMVLVLDKTYHKKWHELKEEGITQIIYVGLSPFSLKIKEINAFCLQKSYTHPPTNLCVKLQLIDKPAALSMKDLQNPMIAWIKAFENLENHSENETQVQARQMLFLEDWFERAKDHYLAHKDVRITLNEQQLHRYKVQGTEINESYLKAPYPPVSVGLKELGYEMGFGKGRKIAKEEVDLSLFQGFIETMSYTLFREWTAQIQEIYPEKKLEIIDERCLVADVEDVLKSSIVHLFDSELYKETLFSEKKWHKIGFILGYLQGRLTTHWYMEYFMKSEPIYQEYAALKAVITLLEFDKIAEIRLNRLYERYLHQDNNLAETAAEVSKLILDDKMQAALSPEKGKTLTIFDNLMLKTVLAIHENKEPDIRLDLEGFLTDELIWEWVEGEAE